MKITKDMMIADVIKQFPTTVEVFFENGFHCLGCAMSAHESLADGCGVHGLDVDEFVSKLNKKLEEKS
tara:strand:- start:475 stop:678 length:204 start_codon:yes stop_codon:yes gene_type:complete